MKRRVWVWVLAGIAVAAAIVLAIFLDLRRKAAAVLARHEQVAKTGLAEIRRRSWKREPLFGSEVPGNRWDAFTAALDALESIPQSDLDEIPEVRAEPGFTPDLEKLDAVFAKHRPSVDLLRDACRRKSLVPPYAYEEGFSMNLPYLTKAIQTSRYLEGAARRRHDLGKDAEAMDLAMLAMIVGQDQAFGGPAVNHLVMIVCESRGHGAAQAVLEGHSLSSKELETIAASVERIWEARPRLSESLEIEDILGRFGLAQLVNANTLAGISKGTIPIRSWRYAFSVDLMVAEALNEYEAFYRDAVALDAVPLPERLSRADGLSKQVQVSRNSLAAQVLPGMGRTIRSDAHALAKWSLLRTALALARYEADQGKLPSTLEALMPRYLPRVPECPFGGGPLRYAAGKVWSLGGDGDDDGGRPQADPEQQESDGDTVWSVRRK